MNAKLLDILKEFFERSELNRLHQNYGGGKIFSTPLIGVATGEDPLFVDYKNIISSSHFTPLEFWIKQGMKKVEKQCLRVISIVFPFTDKIRKESKNVIKHGRLLLPAEIYCVGRNYANAFKKETCRQVISFLNDEGYAAKAPMLSEIFTILTEGEFHSNWSERHAAYAAGLGSFSLHDGFISERGCNIRLASVITNAPLEITPRMITDPYANCLFYAKGTCGKCIERCPAGAISEQGHDKNKCYAYEHRVGRKVNLRIKAILKTHERRINGELKPQKPPVGCAFCQFNVPCMDKNPMAK